MRLEVEHLSLNSITPNEWNPNVQTQRQFAAEMESIKDNGFIMPIITRKQGDGYQIIDGEHRFRALTTMLAQGQSGAGNLAELMKRQEVPAIVLDVDDLTAKRLTVILNETRGRADLGMLAEVLADISKDMSPEQLLSGLPYTQKEIEEIISVTEFDWDALMAHEEDTLAAEDDGPVHVLHAILTDEVADQWRAHLEALRDILPVNSRQAAGVALGYLLQGSSDD